MSHAEKETLRARSLDATFTFKCKIKMHTSLIKKEKIVKCVIKPFKKLFFSSFF